MTEQVASVIEKFITSTIKGQESGLFNAMGSPMLPLTREILQTGIISTIIGGALVDYFNHLYRSLIGEDDQYIVDIFNKMTKPLNHSKVCMLNIVFNLTTVIHLNLNRQNLDIKSYDNYMAEIDKQLKYTFEKYRAEIVTSISHTCKGENIKKCDPILICFILT